MKNQFPQIFFGMIFIFLTFNAHAVEKDRFCKVASYTFMGLIEDIDNGVYEKHCCSANRD